MTDAKDAAPEGELLPPQEFAAFQNEIYLGGMSGQVPAYPTTYAGLVDKAREQLDPGAFGYVAGGAGSEATMRANREAFDRWRIVPRMLTDVSTRDLSLELFGAPMSAPVILAPVGVLGIVHDDAELAVARAAADVGLTMTLSTVSSYTLEEVAEANGDGGRWFQLYWPGEREITASLLERAEKAGYSAIVVTLDTKMLAWRPRDLDQAYLPFLEGKGLANYFTDPAFLDPLEATPEEDLFSAVLRWVGVFLNRAATWDDLAFIRESTDLPIVLKGVLHPDDAREAVDRGCDGIVVSNHGGRQVDGSIASMEALPSVLDAVDGAVPVLLDSGVRTGADAVKAVALGATAVLLSRPWVFGLALGGEDGVRHVLRSFLAELDLSVALAGFRRLDELTPDILARAGNPPTNAAGS